MRLVIEHLARRADYELLLHLPVQQPESRLGIGEFIGESFFNSLRSLILVGRLFHDGVIDILLGQFRAKQSESNLPPDVSRDGAAVSFVWLFDSDGNGFWFRLRSSSICHLVSLYSLEFDSGVLTDSIGNQMHDLIRVIVVVNTAELVSIGINEVHPWRFTIIRRNDRYFFV